MQPIREAIQATSNPIRPNTKDRINRYIISAIPSFIFVLRLTRLYVEEEVHNVSVLNDVFFSFDAEFAGCAAGCF